MAQYPPVHRGVTLAQAAAIVDAVLADARAADRPPMTVVVLDTAGRHVALKREDGSSLLRPEIAFAKANGALAMGMGSRTLGERAVSHPAFIAAVTTLAQGALVPVPGGILLRDASGELLGAVGISGAHSGEDEASGLAGIAAAGLVGQVD